MRATFAALLIFLVFPTACSRKPAQTGPPPSEVLVTTVTPRDVPRILERVATLDGFINANINAQVQGYIVSRHYQARSLFKKGDLVSPTSGPLTTISQIDPIKAIVTAGEGPFTDFVSRHPDPTERAAYIRSLEFDLILGNGTVYPQKGKFYALDRNLDLKTGSIRYEVTFPNPGNNLRPGQFGKVRFVADTKKNTLVVPQEAVSELQGNYQVVVVDQDNKAHIRPVKMGERIGSMWEVTEGLKPGERVVVQGLQKAREGASVTPKDWTQPPDALVSKSDQPKDH